MQRCPLCNHVGEARGQPTEDVAGVCQCLPCLSRGHNVGPLTRCLSCCSCWWDPAGCQDPATAKPTPWCCQCWQHMPRAVPCLLHGCQIVHRDLKPHNVLLTEGGRAKLSDMGLSKEWGARAELL